MSRTKRNAVVATSLVGRHVEPWSVPLTDYGTPRWPEGWTEPFPGHTPNPYVYNHLKNRRGHRGEIVAVWVSDASGLRMTILWDDGLSQETAVSFEPGSLWLAP